jgi:L-asparaginase
MKILFLQTGGTIDKDYAEKAGTYNFEINEPAFSRILLRVRPKFEYEIKSILKKDSLDLTDKDRELIFNTCKNSNSNKIIITHGTDTMVKTASVLSKIKDKLIVLVGAHKPEKFLESDAQFNLGLAVGAASLLEKGVFIAMDGRIFEWDKCCKVPETGEFVEKK